MDGAQFLLRDGDRGQPKAKLVAARLNALNPFADVRTIPGALTLDLLLNYHVSARSSSSDTLPLKLTSILVYELTACGADRGLFQLELQPRRVDRVQ